MTIQLPDFFSPKVMNLANAIMGAIYINLKFLLAGILIIIGILDITKWRGWFRTIRLKKTDLSEHEEEEMSKKLKEPNVILGLIYITFGIGILLNYTIYILMFILEPIPDQFLFAIIDAFNLNPEMAGFVDIDILPTSYLSEDPIERFIFNIIGYVSYSGFILLVIGMRFIIITTNKSHITSYKMMIVGLITCIMTGFTTFMPLFL